MNLQIRTKKECKQWNVDEECVEITHGRRRIFIAQVDLYEDFAKKNADALKATAEKLNTRMFRILCIRSADTVAAAENCPKIVVWPPHKEMEIMIEFLRSLEGFDHRVGWALKGHRYEIYCGEDLLATIEQADETLTHATLRWKFDD